MTGSGDPAAIRTTIIVAMGRNRVIGRAGGLPWRLSSDLRRFRALTLGKPLVMGRKTYEAIGRPLDGRTTVLVTRSRHPAPAGVVTAPSLDEALVRARREAVRLGVREICVVGGAEIYAQALPLADRLLVTEIDLAPEGDARFPALDPQVWEEVSRESGPRGPRDDADHAFVVYERLARPPSPSAAG